GARHAHAAPGGSPDDVHRHHPAGREASLQNHAGTFSSHGLVDAAAQRERAEVVRPSPHESAPPRQRIPGHDGLSCRFGAGWIDLPCSLVPTSSSLPMLRKTLLFVASLAGFALLIAGPLFLVKISQFKAMGAAAAAMAMQPTTITATLATEGHWENSFSATGSVAAVQGVTIGAEVPGKIVKIAFQSGEPVEAGDVLVQLDISTEEAQLRAAEATAALAMANLQRARDLRSSNTNSLAELDAAD